jgi:predicted ATP-dependent endonuclease of OLD family
MKINKIKIAGFRSIKDDLEIPLQNLNAIIGANNSGKSNIINAIYKVLGKDWITKNNFDELDVHNEEYDRDITIEIEFEQPFKYEQFKGIPIDIPKIRFNYTRYKVGELEGSED